MAYVVRMPKLGVEMEAGEVVEWFVGVDEAVEEDDVLAEIESEKSVAEVTARESGVLRRVYLQPGEEVPPGTPMAIVAGRDEDISEVEAEATAELDGETAVESEAGRPPDDTTDDAVESPAPADSTTDEADESGGTAVAGTATDDASEGVAPRTPEGRIKATPKARKLAEQRDVPLETVAGSGPGGSITASDVEEAADGPAEAGGGEPSPSAARGPTVREQRPLSSMRSTIAERLGRSAREAPHVTVDREVDVEAALAAADQAEASEAVEVAITDVVLAAVSATLADHPGFNATYDGDEAVHALYEEHNVGIAVDVEGGLLTPVLSDIRGSSPAEIARARRALVERVLAGEHSPEDLSGGTFTVSNLGAFGSDAFTPIINPPEVAILGVNRVRERPVNTDGGIEFRRHVTFSLSFDHRVLDGADAARFLDTLADYLAAADQLPEPP